MTGTRDFHEVFENGRWEQLDKTFTFTYTKHAIPIYIHPCSMITNVLVPSNAALNFSNYQKIKSALYLFPCIVAFEGDKLALYIS